MFSKECMEYCITLIKSSLTGVNPPNIPMELDIDELYEYSRFHKVEVIVFDALKKLDLKDKSETLKIFEESFFNNVSISMRQKYYYGITEEKFNEYGVMFVPLKGSIIKDLYPESYFRALSDIDIYIGKENAEKANSIMTELGFKTIEYGSKVLIHDTYCISGIDFELHKELMPHIPYFKGVEVCPEIEKDIIQQDGKLRLSNESFYAFMIIHIAKHVKHNGIGLRGFIDVWLFLKKYNDTLNWEKIEYYMQKSHLSEFNKCVLELVEFWFEGKKNVSSCIQQFACHIAENGAIGDSEIMISEEKYKKSGMQNKFKYYIYLIFLPYPYMADKYAVLKNNPMLLPLFWIYRLLCGVLLKHVKVKDSINRLNDVDIDLGEKSMNLKQQIGL